MRPSLIVVVVAGSGLAAAGCAAAQTERTCVPILSWASPAWECSSVAPAAEPEPEPTPEPAAEPPPPEPPPERVVVKDEKIEINEKVQFETGSAVLFPSYLLHRVSPVKQGFRESLVTWVTGPPFR